MDSCGRQRLCSLRAARRHVGGDSTNARALASVVAARSHRSQREDELRRMTHGDAPYSSARGRSGKFSTCAARADVGVHVIATNAPFHTGVLERYHPDLCTLCMRTHPVAVSRTHPARAPATPAGRCARSVDCDAHFDRARPASPLRQRASSDPRGDRRPLGVRAVLDIHSGREREGVYSTGEIAMTSFVPRCIHLARRQGWGSSNPSSAIDIAGVRRR